MTEVKKLVSDRPSPLEDFQSFLLVCHELFPLEQCVLAYTFYVPYEACAFHHANAKSCEITLPPVEAMEGTVREGVVVIVPSLAKTDDSDEPIVSTLICCCEWALAKCVTDRVDTPGNMRRQKNTDGSSPEEARESAEEEGDEEGEEHPEIDESINEDQCAVFKEMGGNSGRVCEIFSGEKPPEVCMPEAVDGAMGISFFIRVCMVDDVGRHPCNGLSFECPSSCNEDEPSQPFRCLKTLVRDHAVVADGYSHDGDDIHSEENPEIPPVEIVVPEENHGHNCSEEWQDDDGEDACLMDTLLSCFGHVGTWVGFAILRRYC